MPDWRRIVTQNHNRRVKSYISTQQRNMLLLVAAGKTNQAISDTLKLPLRAVRGVLSSLRVRFCVGDRTSLVVEALKQNAILLDEIDVDYTA